MKHQIMIIGMALTLAVTLATCQSDAEGTPMTANQLSDVTLMLDWVPNTNHTGIFVAQNLGYFNEAGLNVTIIEPGEVYAEQSVSAGAVDIGISFQEQITLARADGVPLVSIAAILQHNTSAFAARGALDTTSASDWEGLVYGAFGSPFEEPTLQGLMECAGADFEQLEIVNTGFADPLALLSESRIDLAWIFYGWQGIQAEREGLDLDLVMLADRFDCIPDYYTPIFITSETMIQERPEILRSFLLAVTRGYQFAIDDPETAAQILLQAVPELDADLVYASQAWISQYYQADAPRWGEQQTAVWEAYAQWMTANDIIAATFEANSAMTNAFLP